ncbi:toprim domain-containing protein [Rhodanobacter aciditrophus]|uniref:bifunctional DNA primase/helicase n=1 Tax=Rhodanobacter aciditrophus TaxID=1623218 RepID=UPI003CF5D433
MRATEIAQRLSAQVDGVVRLLLPNGKRVGQEWRVGSADGEAGQSLGVHLTGDKAGVWSDFSSGDSGDLVGLWMACRKLSLRDACKEALDYLGIREDRLDPPQRRFQRPTRDGVVRLHSEHAAWLTEARRIAPGTIEAYRLASRDGWLMFPYLRDGELVAAKYRKLPKSFRQDAECEPCLFGWQAIADDARCVIITEGELDAMAWHTYGFPALSVPMGGGGGAKQGWIATEFDRLSVYDTIYLSLDSDGPGQQAEREIAERLGRERCRLVQLPYKDANDCLMQGVTDTEMAGCLRDARTLDPSELKPAADFEDAVWSEFTRVDEGLRLPWQKTHDLLLLRPGETSIWAGVNGHGKSAVISHVVASMATHDIRCCVASMEFRTPVWLMRMVRQIAGTPNPTEAYIRAIVRSLKGQLWAFDVAGAAKAKRILEVFRYARRRYGIELFVIDNLTKCGFADDDYAGQKQFVEELSDFARLEGTHVAIVAHMRKVESEDHPAGKMAVKGSGGITDMVDTVIEVWRNKPLERAQEALERSGTLIPERIGNANTYLNVLKQRATGNEPSIALWFDKSTTQFLAAAGHTPRPMLPLSLAPTTREMEGNSMNAINLQKETGQ